MKRSDEELAKRELDGFLRSVSATSSICWREVPQEQEPPDYYLTWNCQNFAVEATTIMEVAHRESAKPVSVLGASAAANDFLEGVEREARQLGILRGSYAVAIEPLPVPTRPIRRKVTTEILNYVRATQAAPTALREALLEDNGRRWEIVKLGPKPDGIEEVVSFDARWEPEIREELANLIRDAVTLKASKLRSISVPIILVLLDEHHYYGAAEWTSRLSRISEVKAFHTVFRASPDHRSGVLFSIERAWSRKA